MKRTAILLALSLFTACVVGADDKPPAKPKIVHTPAEWKQMLTPEQYNVMVESGTERPGTSELLKEKRDGVFVSAAAPEHALFRSADKFESGTGWPSFTQPITPDAVVLRPDPHYSGAVEVLDASTGLHLGHIFNDGPAPTGKRYCMNGVALKFVPATK